MTEFLADPIARLQITLAIYIGGGILMAVYAIFRNWGPEKVFWPGFIWGEVFWVFLWSWVVELPLWFVTLTAVVVAPVFYWSMSGLTSILKQAVKADPLGVKKRADESSKKDNGGELT